MHKILDLMFRIAALKRTARTGWNMQFPEGHALKSRSVPDAEHVADHSWGLAMLALAVAEELGLDGYTIVWMALVHDVAESVTRDIVTATLPPEEKARAKAEKRILEDRVMRDIFLPLGAWGQRCYALWLAYEDKTSEEARVLHQLDKIEACIQAVAYRREGHAVDPNEFFGTTESALQRPELAALLAELRNRAND